MHCKTPGTAEGNVLLAVERNFGKPPKTRSPDPTLTSCPLSVICPPRRWPFPGDRPICSRAQLTGPTMKPSRWRVSTTRAASMVRASCADKMKLPLKTTSKELASVMSLNSSPGRSRFRESGKGPGQLGRGRRDKGDGAPGQIEGALVSPQERRGVEDTVPAGCSRRSRRGQPCPRRRPGYRRGR